MKFAACATPSAAAPVEMATKAISAAALQTIRHEIERQIANLALDPEWLTKTFNMSRASFYRMFEPLGGVTSYVQRRRLTHARQILIDPLQFGERISEVARRCGFADAAVFSRAFRQAYGVSPSENMPGNFNYLGLLGLMLPGARIVHCVRDPRDVGLSIFTFRFHGDHGYAHRLDDLGWYIGEHDRLMRRWRANSPNPILTVKLSDWVEDFDATLRRVLEFCDLPPDARCARFYEGETRVKTVSRAQVRQPVNARGLGRWRAYAHELQPLIAELEAAGALDGWRA